MREALSKMTASAALKDFISANTKKSSVQKKTCHPCDKVFSLLGEEAI